MINNQKISDPEKVLLFLEKISVKFES